MTYGISIKAPFDLRATLATMKSAKEKGVNMAIWDRDIKAVEDAVELIERLRAYGETVQLAETNCTKEGKDEIG